MSLSKLLGALMALALLFAPSAAVQAAGTPVPAPTAHQMQMSDGEHCGSLPSDGTDHHRKAGGDNCCASTCMAVAVAPAAPVVGELLPAGTATFAAPARLRGLLGELATPPPRAA